LRAAPTVSNILLPVVASKIERIKNTMPNKYMLSGTSSKDCSSPLEREYAHLQLAPFPTTIKKQARWWWWQQWLQTAPGDAARRR